MNALEREKTQDSGSGLASLDATSKAPKKKGFVDFGYFQAVTVESEVEMRVLLDGLVEQIGEAKLWNHAIWTAAARAMGTFSFKMTDARVADRRHIGQPAIFTEGGISRLDGRHATISADAAKSPYAKILLSRIQMPADISALPVALHIGEDHPIGSWFRERFGIDAESAVLAGLRECMSPEEITAIVSPLIPVVFVPDGHGDYLQLSPVPSNTTFCNLASIFEQARKDGDHIPGIEISHGSKAQNSSVHLGLSGGRYRRFLGTFPSPVARAERTIRSFLATGRLPLPWSSRMEISATIHAIVALAGSIERSASGEEYANAAMRHELDARVDHLVDALADESREFLSATEAWSVTQATARVAAHVAPGQESRNPSAEAERIDPSPEPEHPPKPATDAPLRISGEVSKAARILLNRQDPEMEDRARAIFREALHDLCKRASARLPILSGGKKSGVQQTRIRQDISFFMASPLVAARIEQRIKEHYV